MRVESKADAAAAPVLHNDPRYYFFARTRECYLRFARSPKKIIPDSFKKKEKLHFPYALTVTKDTFGHNISVHRRVWMKVRTSICTMRGCMESLMQDFNAMHFVHERPKSTTIPHELAKDHAN